MQKQFVYEFKDEVHYFKDGKDAIAETLTVSAPNNKIQNHVMLLEMEYKKAQMNRQKKAMSITSALDSKNLEKIIEERRSELQAEKIDNKDIKKEETTKHLTAEEILDVLMYGEADIMACFSALKSILTINLSGSAFSYLDSIDGKGERLTSNIWEIMTPQDSKNILGEYISTFIIASQNI